MTFRFPNLPEQEAGTLLIRSPRLVISPESPTQRFKQLCYLPTLNAWDWCCEWCWEWWEGVRTALVYRYTQLIDSEPLLWTAVRSYGGQMTSDGQCSEPLMSTIGVVITAQ